MNRPKRIADTKFFVMSKAPGEKHFTQGEESYGSRQEALLYADVKLAAGHDIAVVRRQLVENDGEFDLSQSTRLNDGPFDPLPAKRD